MKKNEIIEFIKRKINNEFNCDEMQDNMSINIVGSLAVKIRLNKSLDNYFNDVSDIDCIIVVNDNSIFENNSDMFDMEILDAFFNNKVDVINYTIKYGEKRNSINIKFIKKDNLYKLTDIKEVKFKSIRKNSLLKHKPTTKFYGKEGYIVFDYSEKEIENVYINEYHFIPFQNDMFYLCDIHSMLFFSINITSNNYKDLPEIFYFKIKLSTILNEKKDYYFSTLFKYFHNIINSPKELYQLIPKLNIFLIDQKSSNNFITYFNIRKLSKESYTEPIIILLDKRNPQNFIKKDYLNFKFYYSIDILENFSWIKILQNSKINIDCNGNENLYSVIELICLLEIFSNNLHSIFLSRNLCSDKNIRKIEEYYKEKKIFQLYDNLSLDITLSGGLEECFYKLIKLKDDKLIILSNYFLEEETKKIYDINQKYNIVLKLVAFLCNESICNISKCFKNYFRELTNIKTKISKNIKILRNVGNSISLIDILYSTGEFKSKNELHRLFLQNAIKTLDGEIMYQSSTDFEGKVIKIGRRRYYKIE